MCNTIADETPWRQWQNIAVIRTTDNRVHYYPLTSFGQDPRELNRASILACPLRKELVVNAPGGGVLLYGEHDIVGPIEIRSKEQIEGQKATRIEAAEVYRHTIVLNPDFTALPEGW